MPCDTSIRNLKGRQREQAEARRKQSLARLARALADKTAKVVIDRTTGALAFTGTWERDGVADVCAYRALSAANSPELRQAVARAEVVAGRAINQQAVGAGVHSHDGGQSWHAGH